MVSAGSGSLKKVGDMLKEQLDDYRIEADTHVMENATQTMPKNSMDAGMVFIPFRLKRDGLVDPFGNPLDQVISRLPIVAMVLAAEDIDLDADPEEGVAGEAASAKDAWIEAQKREQEAEKEAVEAEKKIVDLKKKITELKGQATRETDEENALLKLKALVEKAGQTAETARRRFARTQAKLETAAKAAKDLGVDVDTKGSRKNNFTF
jgi:hypothetical protein